MKKIVLFIISLLCFVGTIIGARVIADKTSPTINIKGTPTLSCSCGFDDLIDYMEADDTSGIKETFVEERSIDDIINSRKVTFGAIDTHNNVAKKAVPIEISEEFTTYHIEILKPLEIEVNNKFNIKDYFVLKNECGLEIEDRIIVEGLDTKKANVYQIQVKSDLKEASPLNEIFTVYNPLAPKIILNTNLIEVDTNFSFSWEYLESLIVSISDDNDTYEDLYETLDIDYRKALNLNEYYEVYEPGVYDVTYTVKDSDGNTSKAILKVEVSEAEYVPVIEEEIIEEVE